MSPNSARDIWPNHTHDYFSHIPRLPPELRALVWRLTMEPRIVDFGLSVVEELPAYDGGGALMRIASPTLVPAALQTCREARNLKLYQWEHFEVLAALRTASGRVVPQYSPLQERPRYFWLNLDIDTVSVRTWPLNLFLPVAPRIKRLRLARREGAEKFFDLEKHHLAAFCGVEEIQIVCLGQLWGWEGAGEDFSWPCGPDNLYSIETSDGTMMKAAELDTMLAGLREEEDISDAELDALLASRREEEERERAAGSYGYEFPSRVAQVYSMPDGRQLAVFPLAGILLHTPIVWELIPQRWQRCLYNQLTYPTSEMTT